MTNNNQPLTGEELLRKVEENKDLLSELELMRTCGYVSKDKEEMTIKISLRGGKHSW